MRLLHYTIPTVASRTPRYAASPWAGFEAEMDRLFSAALADDAATTPNRFPVDLYEDANATYVRAELPGVNRADLGVELVEGALHLTAKRTVREGNRERTVELGRVLTVPEGAVQADKITAAYENGVLTVTLPKREEAKPRKITVAVS